MNITHSIDEKVTGDKLEAIFTRQKELMEKYHYIEERSGLCQTSDCPVNLDDKRGQARIKDFAWRITEEVGEALDAVADEEHHYEELIDGLHFLTELTILAGRDYYNIVPNTSGDYLESIIDASPTKSFSIKGSLYILIRELGMMCNCLKNKPWKQSQMRTDLNAFYTRLTNVWISYISLLTNAGLSADDIANIYLKKSQVNKFRQRSNY